MTTLLEIKNLSVNIATDQGDVHAVRDVSLSLEPGETLAIVGESGCGKSVFCKSILGILPARAEVAGGEILFKGRDLAGLSEKELEAVRGKEISMIFQDPVSSLNPTMSIGSQIVEAVRAHQKVGRAEARERAVSLMKQVGIDAAEKRFDQYPHHFSGGMLQRSVIAMALACGPDVLIADEPTTALDVTVQAQILQLLRQLKQAQPHSAVILVTHDMGVIAENADRVAVMYAGQIVEEADVIPLFHRPLHPYTEGLMASMPSLTEEKEHLETIEGTVPSIYNMPIGCAFCNRCKYAKDCCRKVEPKMMTLPADESGIIRRVRCLKYDENYRKEWENG